MRSAFRLAWTMTLLAVTARAGDLRPGELRLPPAALSGSPLCLLTVQQPEISAAIAVPRPIPLAVALPAALPAALTAAPLPAAAAAPAAGARAQARKAFAGLDRLATEITASAGDGRGPGDGAGFSGFYDGEREHEHEEAFAWREERKAEAVQYAHAERPVMDYLRGRFDPAEAAALADAEHELEEGQPRKIRDLLQLVMTAHAARPDNPPDLTRVDPEGFGVSDAQVRERALAAGLPVHAVIRFLDLAFRHGLVYRLHDSAREKTYYGVPDAVRAAMNLQAPRAAEEVAREKAKESAFAKGLPALAQAALKLPKGEELFEFAAQIVASAEKEGMLAGGAIPQAFRERAAALDLDAQPLKDALLTLLESSEGTPWFARAKALCETAAADGLLPRAELDSVLKSLR